MKKNKLDFDGQKYRKASALQQKLGTIVLDELELKGSEKILDLGCGDGSLTAKIADCVPKGTVLGIDSSKGMLKVAAELKRENLRFKLIDINEFNFSNQFDIIYSNAALHWVHDHRRLLKNCHTALKTAGIIRFNFAREGNCHNLNSVIKEVIARSEFKKYFIDFIWPWYMPSVVDYTELIGNYNYDKIKIWSQNADKYFSSKDKFVSWIEQPCIVPFLKEISKEKERKLFRDIVVGSMLQKTMQKNGSFFETFRRINVLAVKG